MAASFLEDCKEKDENEYHVVLGAAFSKSIKQDQFGSNFFFYPITYRPATKVFSLQSHDKFFKDLEKKIKPDVVFTTTGPAYWRPKAPHLVGYNLPHHVYPESPYLKQVTLYRKMRWKIKRVLVKYFFTRDADAIVVQTDDVKERLIKLLGKANVVTVSNTYSPFYNNPVVFLARLPAKQADEFRLLTLSAWYPHKNLTIIPKVVDMLLEKGIKNVRFILTLPKEIFDKEFPEKYAAYIINTGPVKVAEAPSLYNECDAMFLPTLLECFSASYAEAMVMGKPILTTDMGFAKTVCGNAAIYFNPVDGKDIAAKILLVMNDKQLQADLINKGKKRMGYFGTSKQRTEEYLSICKDLCNKK